MWYLLFVSTIIPCVFGGVYFDAPCPNLEPVDNFNLAAYATGDWVQIARYPNDFEETGDCVKFNYRNESGKFYLTETEIFEHKKIVFNGYIDYAPNAENKGILVFTSSVIQEPELAATKLPLYVLDVDYDSYAIIFECKYDETKKRRHDFAWVVSRSTQLSDEAKAAVDKYIKSSSYIKPDLLIWNHFDKEHCKSDF